MRRSYICVLFRFRELTWVCLWMLKKFFVFFTMISVTIFWKRQFQWVLALIILRNLRHVNSNRIIYHYWVYIGASTTFLRCNLSSFLMAVLHSELMQVTCITFFKIFFYIFYLLNIFWRPQSLRQLRRPNKNWKFTVL